MTVTGPVHELHLQANAKMADFGGWSMPVEFPGGGVLAEHAAVRNAVGIFDVSHLGKALVSGPGAREFVNSCLTNDLGRIAPGKAQYTLCCNSDGGVADDLIAYLRSAPQDISVTNQHRDYAVFAVQGPRSEQVLAELGLPTGHEYMSYLDAEFDGQPLTVCRTGYTGERGYELVSTWDSAPAVWRALQEAARCCDGLPAGLGARDTLRTEMGYALHGNELSPGITPLEGGVSWAVGWDKPQFWGREPLLEQKQAGVQRRMKGMLALDKGLPRAESVVRDADGEEVGETTSGTFSPTLRKGIALGLLDRSVEFGDTVVVDVRGRSLRCQVVKPPFVQPHTKG